VRRRTNRLLEDLKRHEVIEQEVGFAKEAG
jgi:hypothetical protein